MALEGKDDNEMGTTAVKKLVETLDSYIPEPVRAIDQPFLMPIEDVFSISGRGTVVTGRIERGIVRVQDALEIVGLRDTTTTTCTGVEMFRKLLTKVVLARTAAFCCVVPSVTTLSVARFWSSQVRSSRTPSSPQKSTSCRRKKAAVTLRSSKATVLSSTSVPLTDR